MKENKNGFTLIELLAVIVILGVLLAIAIPSVSKYINTAKKSTYIINVKEYADAAKKEFNLIDTDMQLPVSTGEATVVYFDELRTALENGGKKSSYGAEFNNEYSYIMVVNDGTAEKPHYTYYVAALDEKGYGIGIKEGAAAPHLIAYDELSNENVVQIASGKGITPSEAATSDVYDQSGSNLPATITNIYPQPEIHKN